MSGGGVHESLDRLAGAQKKMAVLTNKPVRVSQAIVQGLGVAHHFFRVYGGNSFEFKKPSSVGIEVLMEQAEVSRERTLMVGDSSVDVETARNARIACCGVTYGFQPESLDITPPDIKVDSMEQMVDWVLGTGARKGTESDES